MRYTLVFDGGSRGNPGPAYGSFRLQRTGREMQPARRLAFGRGTNNQAEYRALIAGVRALRLDLQAEALDPAEVALEVRGDSLLVIRQLAGEWKVRDARLKALWSEAHRLLQGFASLRLVHQDRSRSVRLLGH